MRGLATVVAFALMTLQCRAQETHAPDSAGGARERPLRVVVLSDINSSYGSTSYAPQVRRALRLIRDEWHPDLVLIAGDMIAAQKASLTDAQLRAMWAAFDATVAEPLRDAGIPLAVTLGNHDGQNGSTFRRDRALAAEYWRAAGRRTGLPFRDSASFPASYSFLVRGVFFLVWDASSSALWSDRRMMDWTRAELGSAAARGARHRVVLGHLPLHAVAEGRNSAGNVLRDADSLRTMLESLGVRMLISGHDHAYYPGRRGALELLACGALGDAPRRLLGDAAPPMRTATLIEFGDDVTLTTWELPSSDRLPVRLIRLTELPETVNGVRKR